LVIALPLLFSAFPGQSTVVVFLVVVGAVFGAVVGLVVVVVLLFVPVPAPVPVCAEVVAAEAPTRATPRINAMTCFISLILRWRVPDSANVIRLSLFLLRGHPAGREPHSSASSSGGFIVARGTTGL
jgi:hypothetical protein